MVTGIRAKTSYCDTEIGDRTSPHAEALALVHRTQRDLIIRLEADYFRTLTGNAKNMAESLGDSFHWHDVQKRQWSAQRPFYPGVIDSTHMFLVAYSIDGNTVGTWTVDTERGTVVVGKPAASS
jgi:hypothetical protein